jgi:hypothetical protein
LCPAHPDDVTAAVTKRGIITIIVGAASIRLDLMAKAGPEHIEGSSSQAGCDANSWMNTCYHGSGPPPATIQLLFEMMGVSFSEGANRKF